ncbi:hypothetical protein JQK87_37295, partial [Streptomyces sp. G44]|uniref:hypothetical protein n=1 Tax=Streptomyces sp. G44 TaxID=2807632 RepID=UPI001960E15D
MYLLMLGRVLLRLGLRLLRGPRRTALRRDLTELRARHGGAVARDVEVLGTGGRRSGVPRRHGLLL